MKSLFIVCAAVAYTIAASGCTSGDGEPATSPIDPFGTEPATAGGDPPRGNTDTIAQLCASACVNIQASCPGAAGGTECALQCASSPLAGCEAQFRAFLQCLSGAQLLCSGGSFDAPQCNGAITAVENCLNGSSGGTGTAGSSGTTTPRGA